MDFFIKTYHVVRDILLFPKTISKKIEEQKIKNELKKEEEARQAKLLKETIGSVSSVEQVQAIMGNDLVKEDKSNLFTFNYVAKDEYGKTIKSSFQAKTITEVENFLVNEGYQIIKVEPQKEGTFNNILNKSIGKKIRSGELSFMLTQLSTYLKAGIPLVDSVRILAKQEEKPVKKQVYEKIVYDLVSGQNLSQALENQSDTFPRLLINMVKTSELTGDLPSTLDEMSEYYTEIYQTKKQMMSALTYPLVVLVVAFAVVIFCLVWVVPSFVKMYAETESSLPGITVFTMNLSKFFSHHYITVITVIALLIIAFITMYQNIKSFRREVQKIIMKTPVIGKIVIYSEVSMFTRTFAQLLNHSVQITDTMAILSKISSNEIYKEIIADTLDNLSKGGKISESFHKHWAFPVVAYEMLVTGESTGKLGDMMEKVADHYNNLHKNAITTVKSLLEPMTIVLLAFGVGFILLSIVIPMFDIYGAVGSISWIGGNSWNSIIWLSSLF